MPNQAPEYKSPTGLEKEMGYTREEFSDLFPRHLSGYEYAISIELATINVPNGTIEVHLCVEGESAFTELLKFPILPIQIKFIEVHQSEPLSLSSKV